MALRVHLGAVLLAAGLCACGGGGGGSSNNAAPEPTLPPFSSRAELGENLFFDKNLSFDRTQSCSTCHDPEHAFIDSRLDAFGRTSAVSLGDDGFSLGDRNAPTLSYALFNPEFHQGSHARFNSQQPDYQGFVGGQFHDGRATDLESQATQPPINPIEMAMPDKASVVDRLRENPDYEASFRTLFGETIFDDTEAAYSAMAESIAAFQRTGQFSPFDSKYDRSLTGGYVYDPLSKAALGKALFFSQQFTNCATCHQLHPNGNREETFTSYEYHNIGVPVNENVRAVNGKDPGFVDEGLLNNPSVNEAAERGKFKVPTLRNVAVTGPYMHNGVFGDLKTVIQFYDHFLTGSQFTLNPETGSPWRAPEIPDTVSLAELEDGDALTFEEVEGLVCFLRTLTDARYEHLIEDNGIDCGE